MRNCLLVFVLVLFTLSGYGQCTFSVTISKSNPSICAGNAVLLTANTSGGIGPFTYVWGTGESTQSINVNKEGTYKVTVIDKTPGCAGVSQSTDIAVSPTPPAPSSPTKLTCYNTSTTLTATGGPPGATYEWYDSLTDGNFLSGNASFDTPPITSGIIFYVQTTLNGCSSLRTGVFVSPVAGPTVKDVDVCYNTAATLTASGGDTYTWYDSPTSTTPLSNNSTLVTGLLTATTTYYVVSTFQGCTSVRTPVKANVTSALQTPVTADVTICAGATATLHADPGPGIYAWYDAPTGGTALIFSPDYTTPTLIGSKSYWVEHSINDCKSARAEVHVFVTQIPDAPDDQVQTTCTNSSILLTAGTSPTLTYNWYDAPLGGTLVHTGNTFQTPALSSTTTYYVEAAADACPSNRGAIKVVITAPPEAPSVSAPFTCNGSTATLTPTGPGGTYEWFDSAIATVPIFTGPSFTTPPLTGNKTYYVQTTIGQCTSARIAVTVPVNSPVRLPVPKAQPTCSGSGANLTATGGDSYEWFDSATSTTPIATSQSFTTPPLTGNTTYYVQSTVGDCTSARVSILVTVNPTPEDPIVPAGPTICRGTPANLTASGSGTLQWYDAMAGGNQVRTGPAFRTPNLIRNTTYYVQNVVGNCISGRVPVTVTINTANEPQFQYIPGSVCKASTTNPVPVINNPAGGTFSSSSPVLIIDPNTGEIDLAASPAGVYTITFAGRGTCAVPERQQFKIYDVADATFTYNSTYCQDDVNPKAIFAPLSSAGTFSASPAGLVFVNTSNGEIDLKDSAPNIYTITNTLAATPTCNADVKTFTVTIEAGVVISAGPNQTVGRGSNVQLAGSVTGSTGTWSGGSNNFSDPTSPTAVYTPGAGETTATLTFTSGDPAGSCGPQSDKMVITFKAGPALPTVTGNQTCNGSAANLSATAPGGTYNWYEAPTGGLPVSTGANFLTPVLTGNVTYYVEAVNNIGISSGRGPVVVTVNTVPPAPVVPSPPICAGNPAILAPADQTGTFEWFDVATGGTPISRSTTFTSPDLTANQTYYVEQTKNGCTSVRTQIDVVVSTPPNVTSGTNDVVCSGTPLNYTMTADNPAATFVWSRNAVPGISNPAVINQTSPNITETLINTAGSTIIVTYTITAYNGTCPGPILKYKVTVNPTPQVTSSLTPPAICNKDAVNYNITFNTPAEFSWKRDAVPGIQNAAVTGQSTQTIRETLINTTNAPINVNYIISSTTGACAGADASLKITVNPSVIINSPNPIQACSGEPLNYQITSNIPDATYIWSRAAVPGIANPAVDNQNASLINEVITNTNTVPITVVYKITPVANGCPGEMFFLVVTVNPQPSKPVANSNSPICTGSTIQLRTPDVANATFKWTGPNGYSSNLQNPDILNATLNDIGDYNLVVISDAGCQSEVSTASVLVRAPGIANAGDDQTVCITDPEIVLQGTVRFGAGTGIWSSSSASPGTFSSLTDLNAHYKPSDAERAVGKITFTLTTTSDDDCAISSDDVIVYFGPLPAVNAGPDQEVCVQTAGVQLHGSPLLSTTLAIWTSNSVSGRFANPTDYNTTYIPSDADRAKGSVDIYLNVTNPGRCQIAIDTMTVKFLPPAEVHTEKIRYVLKDRTITLNPTVSDPNVTYLWTPNVDIDNNTLKNPTITGVIDRTYTLTVTDSRGCLSVDSTIVKVSPKVVIPNTFTPNNDGVNDLWNIQGLIAYTEATVDIFTRYGQKVYHSVGYDKPWDGIYNGKQLPTGVYYYVIDTKLFNQVLSGNVTLLR